jgi:hypothetical protein
MVVWSVFHDNMFLLCFPNIHKRLMLLCPIIMNSSTTTPEQIKKTSETSGSEVTQPCKECRRQYFFNKIALEHTNEVPH